MRSLRTQLLAWLLLPLLVVLAINLAETWYRASQTATLVTDRLLLASARVIAEQVRDAEGYVEASIPPAALEMFASSYQDKIVYQVTAPSGELIAGFPDVPNSERNWADAEGFDARFRTEPVRVLALSQPVVSHARPARVLVGTTLRARDAMRDGLWNKAVRDQAVIVAMAVALLVLGLWQGLAPLRRLSGEVMAREPHSLTPVGVENVQVELRPLIAALNHALERVSQHVSLQRRFIANAAHQMRTPLAVLKTQAVVGQRERDGGAKDEALSAMESSVDGLARLVNQLLMLARAEPGGNSLRMTLDATVPTRAALEQLAVVALDRRIDLTFRADDTPVPVEGHVGLLQDLVMNLAGNALDATPRDGSVEVSLGVQDGMACWTFADTGCGIPPEERCRVFERFYRLPGSSPGGTGLGLAIVSEIVQAHGGKIELTGCEEGPGLCVRVRLPLSAKPPEAVRLL